MTITLCAGFLIFFFAYLLPKIKTKLRENPDWKNKFRNVLGVILGIGTILLLVVSFTKVVLWDVIVGEKAYDDNGIVIGYHRIVNIIHVKNNSDLPISFCYRKGYCEYDRITDRISATDVEYSTKRSEIIEIPPGEKARKWGTFCDAYLLILTNEEGLYDVAAYNKKLYFGQ